MEEDTEGEEIEETSRVHGETQMQWMSTEEEGEIERAITVGNGAIWPEIVGKEIKQG